MKKNDNEKRINITSGGAVHPVTEKIDEFAEHLYNGDITISLDAWKVPFSFNYQKGSLGTFLTTSVSNYLTSKGNRDPVQIAAACDIALVCITHARATGLIIENPSLLGKLKVAEEENKRLKDNQQKLEEQNIKLKKENQELHKALNDMGFKSVFNGEKNDEQNGE
jgi:hypothetical protein